jgi:DNA polymerase
MTLMDALESLRHEAATCRACGLYARATQTVFGEGPAPAPLMLVGEQPGDHEDIVGRPFVGPAGRLLDDALEEIGLDRTTVYITNAVKHFKWVARGKRRIHQTPLASEIEACRQWLAGELEVVNPALVVALGATAAKALFGPQFRVSKQRGEIVAFDGRLGTATVHPSSLLRIADREERHREFARFTADLAAAVAHLEESSQRR